MGGPGSENRRRLGLARFAPVAWVALAWLGAWFTGDHYVRATPSLWGSVLDFLDRFSFRAFGGFPAAQEYVAEIIRLVDWYTAPSLATFAAWATFLVPLGFVARIVARARIRAGAADPLDRLRSWTDAHVRWTRTILGILPSLWGAVAFRDILRYTDHFTLHDMTFTRGVIAPFALACIYAQYLGARVAVRAFLTPTIDPTEETRIEIGPDEIAFDAVAVTREARAAVGGLAAVSVAMVAWLATLPIETLFRDPRIFTALAVYSGAAIVGAAAFRVASRVAVGVDGVLVKGTSRRRFYAYRDLEGARVASGDIELLRRGTVVLRLQLHGADAVRRDAVAARIRENVERVRRGEHAVAAQLVSSSSKDQLARVASGGADYRAASLSREALWALIEGPAVDADARRAAAEALSKTSDESERARLRVAAEHCADPRVRVALAELAESPDDRAGETKASVPASRQA
jgi:hypothetical protein